MQVVHSGGDTKKLSGAGREGAIPGVGVGFAERVSAVAPGLQPAGLCVDILHLCTLGTCEWVMANWPPPQLRTVRCVRGSGPSLHKARFLDAGEPLGRERQVDLRQVQQDICEACFSLTLGKRS